MVNDESDPEPVRLSGEDTSKPGVRRKPPFIADLDSATSVLQATSAFLQGADLKPLRFMQPAAPVASRFLDVLPSFAAEQMYSWGGWIDAIPLRALGRVDFEEVSQGVVNMYPERRYPAVMLGATNGAVAHLAASLGIPWLPQTLLLVVRRHVHPDHAQEDLEWAREPVERLVRRNPDVRVYQHHDPNQDRLMLRHMAYFRIKRLRLGAVLESYLRRSLQPGGTLVTLECGYEWPSTRVSDRHYFQFGGWGGLSKEEYLSGGPKVEAHLKELGAPVESWDPPEPSGYFPEAEWGFDPELASDIERFVRKHGYRWQRLRFDSPQALSPPTADLYRDWYGSHGLPTSDLYVESFTHVHPRLTVRAGLVPYWSVFNDRPSVEALRNYLDETDPYERIYLSLFSNSTEALGIAPIEEWREILDQARSSGRFLGVREEKYPRDLGSFVRHFHALKELDRGFRIPPSISLEKFREALSAYGDGVRLEEASPDGVEK